MRRIYLLILCMLHATAAGQSTRAQSPPSAELQFFEQRIRPVIIEYCVECHSAETEASGGLLLDSQEGWSKGGDTGVAILPGQPEASPLFQAITYQNPDLQMPPDGMLPNAVIADFRTWIAAGALDPREAPQPNAPARKPALSVENAQEHWAYQPLQESARQDLCQIDCLIDQRLAEMQLPAGPSVERSVLARRLYFDLIGLPPTPEQLLTFVECDSDTAYETLVDELLASPRFGETFARRWMDVVRYADSITLRGFVLPEAWRYRDYLIDCYNRDRPFDSMIREQIAGDLLSSDDASQRRQQLIATGFLALGNTNLEQQDKSQLEMDYLDEQLDIVGQAFLGQTIGCARCHDHKFDPIPTADYYALAGILRSSVGLEHDNVSKWIEQNLPLPPDQQQKYEDLSLRVEQVSQEIAKLNQQMKQFESDPLKHFSPADLPGIVIDDTHAELVGDWTKSDFVGPSVGEGYIHDGNAGKGEKTATFEPNNLPAGRYEVRLAYQSSPNRTARLAVKIFSADGETTVYLNQQKPAPEEALWWNLGEYRFEEDGQAYVLITNANTRGHVVVDAVQFLPLEPGKAPPGIPDATLKSETSQQASLEAKLRKLQQELSASKQQLAERPRYLTIHEQPPAKDIPIHIRGNVHTLGEVVPRGFLTAVPPATARSSQLPPSRLDLANWIADPANPLTARVYANRVWSWLMGQGLVSTVNNFGTTGSRPTHPELLDQLANDLLQSNWSTKTLVRKIVLSNAYRRVIWDGDERAQEVDPENRFYWRGHARRISVEAMRDAMLMISGELDLTVGGSLIKPNTMADYNYTHASTRRSVYQPVFRNSLPDLYEVFDFADTSVSIGQRSRSTVAPQALGLVNHPWVTQRATATAKHFAPGSGFPDDATALQALFLRCFSRLPTADESQICCDFLAQSQTQAEAEERWQQLVQSLFASLDFRFLD